MYTDCLQVLKNSQTAFSRKDLQQALSSGEAYTNKIIRKLLNTGKVARVGRNQYRVTDDTKAVYQYDYSSLSKDVAALIEKKHPYLAFTVFELVQLNCFANHLFGRNIIYVFVEADFEDYVFQTLSGAYPHKVLVCPDIETYNRYAEDGSIVILKLKSEAPNGRPVKWHTRLEKLIVDLFTERLIIETVSSGELPVILGDIFDRNIIDEDCLFRYARRRGAEQKIRDYLATETAVKLRTEEQDAQQRKL